MAKYSRKLRAARPAVKLLRELAAAVEHGNTDCTLAMRAERMAERLASRGRPVPRVSTVMAAEMRL